MHHKISAKLTLTETFNLGCDIDLEHSNPTVSLDTSLLMMIYTQIEFGCKRLTGLELIKYIIETVIFWLYKPIVWPWPWTIPRKYLQSANLSKAMSQMVAMKMLWFLPKKAHSGNAQQLQHLLRKLSSVHIAERSKVHKKCLHSAGANLNLCLTNMRVKNRHIGAIVFAEL